MCGFLLSFGTPASVSAAFLSFFVISIGAFFLTDSFGTPVSVSSEILLFLAISIGTFSLTDSVRSVPRFSGSFTRSGCVVGAALFCERV